LASVQPRPPAISVYTSLVASPTYGGRARAQTTRRIVKSPDGSPLLRLERQRTEVVLRIPNVLVDSVVEKELTRVVIEVLAQRKALIARRADLPSADARPHTAGEPLATCQSISP
ncbi:MAG: hypothetical protein ACRES1_10855, partial [Steroidobacteraceae bacterium]